MQTVEQIDAEIEQESQKAQPDGNRIYKLKIARNELIRKQMAAG